MVSKINNWHLQLPVAHQLMAVMALASPRLGLKLEPVPGECCAVIVLGIVHDSVRQMASLF